MRARNSSDFIDPVRRELFAKLREFMSGDTTKLNHWVQVNPEVRLGIHIRPSVKPSHEFRLEFIQENKVGYRHEYTHFDGFADMTGIHYFNFNRYVPSFGSVGEMLSPIFQGDVTLIEIHHVVCDIIKNIGY